MHDQFSKCDNKKNAFYISLQTKKTIREMGVFVILYHFKPLDKPPRDPKHAPSPTFTPFVQKEQPS